MSRAMMVLVAFVAMAGPAAAQDAVEVAPAIYTVVFENEHVRVLKAVMPLGAKTPMHEHPPHVVIPLQGSGRFTLPDGKTIEPEMAAGVPVWDPGGKHASESIGNTTVEGIIVELKGKK